jgi:hypothetical protein
MNKVQPSNNCLVSKETIYEHDILCEKRNWQFNKYSCKLICLICNCKCTRIISVSRKIKRLCFQQPGKWRGGGKRKREIIYISPMILIHLPFSEVYHKTEPWLLQLPDVPNAPYQTDEIY